MKVELEQNILLYSNLDELIFRYCGHRWPLEFGVMGLGIDFTCQKLSRLPLK